MPITPFGGSLGESEAWQDFSGGQLIFTITAPAGSTTHYFRVAPFDTAGTALYSPVITGAVTGADQEAQNLFALLQPLYNADTTIAFVGINQTLNDHSGVAPYAHTYSGTVSGAGNAAGASLPVYNVEVLQSRGSDGSRWRLTLPGVSSTITAGTGGRALWSGYPASAIRSLVDYLCGITNGPVNAAKSGVVTHNGVAIQKASGATMSELNKRLRRRFKVV